MGHQAINDEVYVKIGVLTHLVHSSGTWDPGWYNRPNAANWSYARYLAMPATVNNPKRSDGTRPVSEFWTHRYLAVLPPLRLSQTPSVGGWGMYTKESIRAAYHSELLTGNGYSDMLKVLPDMYYRTNVDSIARVNFLKKLEKASGKSQVELGVAAGEVRETIHMVTDLSKGLVNGVLQTAKSVSLAPARAAKALYAVRQYGVKEAARRFLNGDTALLEKIIQGWLVTQFGLKPLASDVYDATVYLGAQQQAHGPLRLTVTVKSGFDAEPVEAEVLAQQDATDDATYALNAKFLWYGRVHYSGVYQIPTRATIPQELGVYNPALVAWELLRFSWLVDYVVDIGGWFRSMMAAQGTHFVEGTKSELWQARLVEFTDRPYSSPGQPGAAGAVNRLGPSIQADLFKRTVLGPAGVMPPILPGMQAPMGIKQLANALAALTTLVGARSLGGPWHLRQ